MRASFLLGFSLILVLVACGDLDTSPDTSAVPSSTTTSSSLATTMTTLSFVAPDPLVVVGSWGTGDPPQGMVAGELARLTETLSVEAILTTGDNLYTDDYELVLHSYDWVEMRGIDFWITWGESDVVTQTRIDAVEHAFGSPPPWVVREWGGVRVVTLDSTQPDNAEQSSWLAATLAASNLPTIVVYHHPRFSCGPGSSGVGFTLDDSVFLVLNGRDRNYQRFTAEGRTWVVTAGGGQTPQPFDVCITEELVPDQYSGEFHFLILTQTETSVVVEAFDLSGELIDRMDLVLP